MKSTIAILLLLHAVAALSQEDFWQQTGGPYAGNVYTIAVHPTDRIFAVVGTGYGHGSGLYSSANDGRTWSKVDVPGGSLQGIGAGPDGELFASVQGDSTFRSTDLGRTWSINSVPGFSFMTFDVSGDILAATGNGVYRSSDNGETWISIGPPSTKVSALTINTDGTLFVGTAGKYPPPVPSEYGFVYRSTDRGETWVKVLHVHYDQIYSLTHDRLGHLFAGTRDFGVYRSVDLGMEWQRIRSPLDGYAVLSLATDSSQHVFAGTAGSGVFRSIDGGVTWTQDGLDTKHVLALMVTGNNRVLAGTYYESGFHVRLDTWTPRGIPLTSVWALTIDSNGLLYAGVYGGGFVGGAYRSTDRGVRWSHINTGLTNTWVSSLAADAAGNVYAGGGSGVFKSSDHGSTWSPTPLTRGYIYALLPTNGNALLAGGDDSGYVYRSADAGLTWSVSRSNPLAGHVFQFASDHDGTLYAAISDEGILKSTDDGVTWSHTASPDNVVESICVTSRGHIFVGTWRNGIFRSTDKGVSWTQSNNGLTTLWVWALVCNSHDHIYAGTIGGGVFRSLDDGDTWAAANSGLTGVLEVRALAFDDEERLFVGLGSGGVCRSSLQTTTGVSGHQGTPVAFLLLQNYPNPFNPSTTIRYSLPERSHVTLTVFNCLGQQMATLVQGEQQAGHHEVTFDGGGLASGLYLYRLQARSYSACKKFVLLR